MPLPSARGECRSSYCLPRYKLLSAYAMLGTDFAYSGTGMRYSEQISRSRLHRCAVLTMRTGDTNIAYGATLTSVLTLRMVLQSH
eukprot:2898416-Rhodomonas_salina.2